MLGNNVQPFCFIQEKLYQWMVRQHEIGLRLTVSDIASHIQVQISICRLITLLLYYI